MAKGIFTTKVNPTYDDLPEVRYHLPKTYLNQAKATVGNEYQLILQSGFAKPTGGQWEGADLIAAEEPEAYVRPIVEQLTSRPFRKV